MVSIGQSEADRPQHERLEVLISGEYAYAPPRRREIREAKVLSVDDGQVIVDLGVKVEVSSYRDHIIVSLSKGLTQRDGLRAKDRFESGETCNDIEGGCMGNRRSGRASRKSRHWER